MTVEDLLEELQEKLGTGEVRLFDDVEVSSGSAFGAVSVRSLEKISGTAVAFAIDGGRICDETHCLAEFTDSDEESLEAAVEALNDRVKALRSAIKEALKTPDARCTILEEALEEDED